MASTQQENNMDNIFEPLEPPEIVEIDLALLEPIIEEPEVDEFSEIAS
jgi:hypothetical protein